MGRIASIIIGIGNYQGLAAESGLLPLQHAVDDADAFESYIRTCWEVPAEAHVARISEDCATVTAITESFADLAQKGPHDLLLVYFSGHASNTPTRKGLFVQPTEEDIESFLLSPSTLDRQMRAIDADQTVLILDCCYAEAIVAQMPFFSSLEGSSARLYIASSRADQLTWEESKIGSGVFTAHLLDYLNAGSVLDGNEYRGRKHVSVDSELFRFLCDQVPLYVLEHKGKKQEPVKGGVATASVLLPISSVAARLHGRTPFSTALRRVRQIFAGVALTLLLSLIFIYTFVYYIEVDENDELVILHGTRSLDPVIRYLPRIRLGTGISVAELSDNPAIRHPVQTGLIRSIWTHQSRHGYRAWYDLLRPKMQDSYGQRYDTLMGLKHDFTLSENPSPREVEEMIWISLSTQRTTTAEKLAQYIPGSDRAVPLISPLSPSYFDFGILDLSPDDLVTYSRALKTLALLDSQVSATAYFGFHKAVQEWLFHNRTRWQDRRFEVIDAVSSVFPSIVNIRLQNGDEPFDQKTIAGMLTLAKQGYAETAGVALARYAQLLSKPAELREFALTTLQNDSDVNQRLTALIILEHMFDGTDSAKESVQSVYDTFSLLSLPDSYLSKFILDAIKSNSLPDRVKDNLLEKAREAINVTEFEYGHLEVCRILAYGPMSLTHTEDQIVLKAIGRLEKEYPPNSTTLAEIYSALHGRDRATEAMVEKVEKQVAALVKRYQKSPVQSEYIGPGITIVAGGPEWVLALADIGLKRALDAQSQSYLRYFANNRNTKYMRYRLVEALRVQNDFAGQGCTSIPCLKFLRDSAIDSEQRQLEVEFAALDLADLPRNEYLNQVNNLRELRDKEVEPELRIALGKIIMSAQFQKLR